MSIHIARDNPFRPADWRWQRAIGVREGTAPNPGRRRDGPQGYYWIRRAVNFKNALDACTDDAGRHRLAGRTPDIFWAHYAWVNENKPLRWDLEAMLLARANDWEIGFALGVAPEVVRAYENLFFNVRDKLMHRRYIVHCVFGPAIHRGLSEREYDTLWKLYAFFYGPHVLESLVTKMVNPIWCSTPDTVNSTLQDDAISSLKFKAAMAAKTVPVNSTTQIDLLNVFTKFVEVERTTDSIGKAQNQILDHIEAMLTTLPFSVAGRDPETSEQVPQSPMSRFRKTSVELNYREVMQVAVGHHLPNQGSLEQLVFPLHAANIESQPLALEAPRAGEAGGVDEQT